MVDIRLRLGNFVTICSLISTHVARTHAIPLARTSDPSHLTRSSSTPREADLYPHPQSHSNIHSLTNRQLNSTSPEVFVYYGQVLPSQGAQLSDICADPNIDKIALAFVTSFADTAGYPVLSIGKNCPTTNAAQTATGATGLRDCVASGLSQQVAACQKAGKPVLLSLGGGTATNMIIPSQDAAQRYANSLWDLYLGNVGNIGVRPFGSVILDGIDIDIEHGSGAYLIDLVIALRKLMDASTASTGRRYYVTAAPQCSDLIIPTSPVPATTIPWLTLAPYLDTVMVQFYNNPTCDFTSMSSFMVSLTAWSQALAKTVPVIAGPPGSSNNISTLARPDYRVVSVDGLSTRSDVEVRSSRDTTTQTKRSGSSMYPKLLVGVTATSDVGSGYVPIASLAPILQQVSTIGIPNLAGVMFWDGVWCMTQSTSTSVGKTFQSVAQTALTISSH